MSDSKQSKSCWLELASYESESLFVQFNADSDRLGLYLSVRSLNPAAELSTSSMTTILEKASRARLSEPAQAEVQSRLSRLQEQIHHCEYHCIYSGTAPVHGVGAKIVWCVEEPVLERADDEDNVDIYASTQWVSVSKGDVLFVIEDATAGCEGIDIFGVPIAALDGKESAIRVGDHCRLERIEETQSAQCVATQDGVVRLDHNVCSVSSSLEIRDDLSFDVGNIDFHGNVLIRGDVPSGFVVKATGDVSILGRVLASTIESGGNIRLGLGMVGGHSGRLVAEGSIEAKYIRDASVVAQGDLAVQRELAGCDARIGGIATIGGTIMGGRLYASGGVETAEVGVGTGQRTFVAVGFPMTAPDHHKELLAQLEVVVAQILNVEHRGGAQLDAPREDLPSHARRWLSGLRSKRRKLAREVDVILEKIETLVDPSWKPDDEPGISIHKGRQANVYAHIAGRCRYLFTEPRRGRHCLRASTDGSRSVQESKS